MASIVALTLAAALVQGSPGPNDSLQAALQGLLPTGAPAVELTVAALPPGLDHPEAFVIECTPGCARVQGATRAGVARGAARLLRELPLQDGSEAWRIAEAPATEWRGLMIDVARFPHAAQDVEDTLQLAWLLGLNRVHLHLTDDQLFTFPSEAFPELGSVGPNGERRHFTRAELTGLVRFADVRGIQLVPEIDMPAHAGVMVRARPDLFGTTDLGTGKPRSTGVVNMANEGAYDALEILLTEVAEVFWNSEFIHLGADEVWAQHLRELPEYRDYCSRHGLPLALEGDVGELYCHFVGRTAGIVRGLGRRPIVWEGFHGTGTEAAPMPRDVLVMAWNLTFQSPVSLVENGFEVINCAWDPMYVVPSQCYAADVQSALDWNVHTFRQRYGGPEFTLPASAPVLGGQVCVWEQRPESILPSAYEPLAAVAERMWDPSLPSSRAEHLKRRARLDRAVERALGDRVRQHRLPAMGAPAAGEDPGPGYRWAAAWPIPLGTGEILDPAAIGVKSRGFMPAMTSARAQRVNHELFARVQEEGHVDTRIPALHADGLDWLPRRQWQPYALELRGHVWLPEPGEWTFFVRANDGAAELRIGGATVAVSRGNDRAQGAGELAAGLYALRVRYHFEYVQNELNLMVRPPGESRAVPLESFLVSHARALELAPSAVDGEPAVRDASTVPFSDPSRRLHPSLATGKPVATTAPHQGAHVPARAVDGVVGNGSGWHCGESPASLTVDLGQEHPVNRVRVHLYHDGGRRYRYVVDTSADGKAWARAADVSKDAPVSTPEGSEHRFDVRPARFVRLTLLGNSANEGVHVNELLVFADGAAPK